MHLRQTAKLRIGVIDCVPTFDALDLPGAVARFSERHPEALVELETDTPAGLQNSLLKGLRDVIVGGSLQPMPGLVYRELGAETHHLYCGRDHPWFTRPDRDLTQAAFVKAAFSVRSYMHFDDTYRLGRVTARATVGSMEAQEIFVLSGRYVGFLPEHRGRLWQGLGRMRAVKTNDWSLISRFYASHAGRAEGEALRSAFMTELEGHAARRIGGSQAQPQEIRAEPPPSS